ncbi:MAG: phenylalanine--tRNA ligase subunit beta [Candidatus Saccharibacteria bacterium]
MKVSLNWIKQYLDFELPPVEELVEKIGAQLGAVEEVIDLGARYQGIVIVKVVECRKLEDSDHLNICLVDDGGNTPDIAREANGLIQVVCGAPNVRVGMFVAWLPPGSTVPSTYGKEPFVLEARPLRGVISNGMLASAKELALGDSHDGLLELDDTHKPGEDFARVNGLNDTIIDIENKMFTHRPDAFGQLGVAREIAGILGHDFHSPPWYVPNPELAAASEPALPLEIQNEIPGLVPRFSALVLDNITVAPSPIWLQVALTRVGLRPINNIVDITNYVMMLTGQPMHAYDYAKVTALSGGDAPVIVVRNPRASERLTLLNGKTVDPRQEAIVIATDTTIIGLGGVMGGAETEVDAQTRTIILESASFDMYSIRRTSMAHGIFSDAVTRFNKGQSPLQTLAVLSEAVRLVVELTGARLASNVIDSNSVPPVARERASLYPEIHIARSFINDRLGLTLPAEAMATLLRHVEIHVDYDESALTVQAPFWRTDIELREDVVEEVARLYGFDKLPLDLPLRPLSPSRHDALLDLKQIVRTNLSRAGANEVLTYSFVHGNLLDRVGQERAHAFKLGNALSPDLQYYRLSMTPSLLDKIHPNIKAGYDQFGVFEIGKTHSQLQVDASSGLPIELPRVALVFAADAKAQTHYRNAPYYHARVYAMNLLTELGLADATTVPLQLDNYDAANHSRLAYYEPAHSATIMLGDIVIGEVGEYKLSVHKALKLPEFVAGFELDLGALLVHHKAHKTYVPLPHFPKVSQDICLRVAAEVPYQALFGLLKEAIIIEQLPNVLAQLEPVDIYVRPEDDEFKQITFRLNVASYERTLTDNEISRLLDKVTVVAHAKYGAERI